MITCNSLRRQSSPVDKYKYQCEHGAEQQRSEERSKYRAEYFADRTPTAAAVVRHHCLVVLVIPSPAESNFIQLSDEIALSYCA